MFLTDEFISQFHPSNFIRIMEKDIKKYRELISQKYESEEQIELEVLCYLHQQNAFRFHDFMHDEKCIELKDWFISQFKPVCHSGFSVDDIFYRVQDRSFRTKDREWVSVTSSKESADYMLENIYPDPSSDFVILNVSPVYVLVPDGQVYLNRSKGLTENEVLILTKNSIFF